MREFIVAAAALALTAGPSFAQSERGYVNLSGGVAASSDVASGDVLGEVGVKVAPNLFVFGDLGRFHNLQPSLVQPAVDATDAMLAATGVGVTGTARMLAWYSIRRRDPLHVLKSPQEGEAFSRVSRDLARLKGSRS